MRFRRKTTSCRDYALPLPSQRISLVVGQLTGFDGERVDVMSPEGPTITLCCWMH